MKEQFEELVQNGWLTEEESQVFLNDTKMIDAAKYSTSPVKSNIFNALRLVSFDNIKVLILGKDPYPNPKDAHGLAFSSLNNTTPDSLKNIFKAIDSVYSSNLFEKSHNELTSWANQGVLLLNTGLTYQKIDDLQLSKKERDLFQARTQKEHMKIWKPFINLIIQKILTIKNRPIVMMLWGNDAHNIVFNNVKNKEFKTKLHERSAVIVPDTEIMLLQCSHPSPLSVNRGGDFPVIAPEHFVDCNKHLKDNQINWTRL